MNKLTGWKKCWWQEQGFSWGDKNGENINIVYRESCKECKWWGIETAEWSWKL